MMNQHPNINSFVSNPIHSAQFMGMVNALRTGDPTVDLYIAMFAPIVLGFLVQRLLPKLLDSLTKWTKWHPATKPSFHRTVSCRYSVNGGVRVNMDEDSYNFYLIKAIKLYVHSHCHLRLDDAHIELTSMNSDGSNATASQNRSQRQQNGLSMAGMLKSCELVERPVQQQWHKVGVYAGHSVSILFNDSLDGGGAGKNNNDASSEGGGGGGGGRSFQVLEIQLKCREGGTDPINTFVKKAYEWYQQELDQLDQNERFLFDLRSSSMNHRSSTSNPVFTRYKLGDEKTFDSLFSKQCKALLNMVDQFQNKTGKYAIQGYPHKFGLLLTGPP